MPPVKVIDVDFGDTEFVVRRHPDGLYTVEIPEPQLVLNQEQFEELVRAFVRVGHEAFVHAAEAAHDRPNDHV